MVIGLSGVAGSGKDTFYELLDEQINCKRVSLADSLKREVSGWTLKHYGIDALTCSREDKEKIREFLVFHGSRKREVTDGRYWIDQVMKTLVYSDRPIRKKQLPRYLGDRAVVITDIRYDDYPADEVSWLRDELKGVLVHISQKYILPANTEEERNDPRIKSKADYIFETGKIKGSEQDIKSALRPRVKEFIEWIKDA